MFTIKITHYKTYCLHMTLVSLYREGQGRSDANISGLFVLIVLTVYGSMDSTFFYNLIKFCKDLPVELGDIRLFVRCLVLITLACEGGGGHAHNL